MAAVRCHATTRFRQNRRDRRLQNSGLPWEPPILQYRAVSAWDAKPHVPRNGRSDASTKARRGNTTRFSLSRTTITTYRRMVTSMHKNWLVLLSASANAVLALIAAYREIKQALSDTSHAESTATPTSDRTTTPSSSTAVFTVVPEYQANSVNPQNSTSTSTSSWPNYGRGEDTPTARQHPPQPTTSHNTP